ncbi:MAG: helix-turn-helix domain-containing protein [Pseudomonadota bacterium]
MPAICGVKGCHRPAHPSTEGCAAHLCGVHLGQHASLAVSYSRDIRIILTAVALASNITTRMLLSSTRVWAIAHPRQMAMHLLQKHSDKSTAQIARTLKLRNRTTVVHGVQQVNDRLRANPEYREYFGAIDRTITKFLGVEPTNAAPARTGSRRHRMTKKEALLASEGSL